MAASTTEDGVGRDPVQWPLLTAQLGIWYQQLLNPDSTFYSISHYVDIHGPVDAAKMRAAHRSVEREAEALRLRFTQTDSGPVQSVEESAESPLHYLDVSADPDPDAAAGAWMRADMGRTADLPGSTGLYTAALFKLGASRFRLFQ